MRLRSLVSARFVSTMADESKHAQNGNAPAQPAPKRNPALRMLGTVLSEAALELVARG